MTVKLKLVSFQGLEAIMVGSGEDEDNEDAPKISPTVSTLLKVAMEIIKKQAAKKESMK